MLAELAPSFLSGIYSFVEMNILKILQRLEAEAEKCSGT